MTGIYNRLPQSLKENETLEGGGVLSGLDLSISENTVIVTSAELYWSEIGIVNFPETRLDISPLPGDYILGVGYFPIPESKVVSVEDASPADYAVSLKALFTDPLFRVENLLEGLVFKPGYSDALLTIEASGLTAVKLQTDYEVVYNGEVYLPIEGFVFLEVSDKVELVFPDQETEIKSLSVYGELSFRDGRSTGTGGGVSLFLQPVGRSPLSDLPSSRINIGLLNFNSSGKVKLLRKFSYETPNFDITKVLTEFWDEQLEAAYGVLFSYIPDYLSPLTAYKVSKDWETRKEASPSGVEENLEFLAQKFGWQGDYFRNVGRTLNQKRNLIASSFGFYPLTRKDNPQIADMTILFTGATSSEWVNNQEENFVTENNINFVFPLILEQVSPNGIPWRFSPYILEGSYVYFEEAPRIEADFDPEVEYIDSLNKWRARASQIGSFKVSRLAGVSEVIEYNIIPWNPEERSLEGDPSWYGAWGSKGTLATLQALCNLVELHGCSEQNTIRLRSRVVTKDIPGLQSIWVDGIQLGSTRFLGVENRTTDPSKLCISFDPGVSHKPAFSKVEVEVTGGERLDITDLLTENPKYSVYASKLNAPLLMNPWFTPAPVADGVLADVNEGTESKHGFLRLPLDYERSGDKWASAEAICQFFALYGKEEDSIRFQEKKKEPVTFYESSFRNTLKRKLYQEDYLISLFRGFDLPDDGGYETCSLLQNDQEEEAGWKEASRSNYEERYSRRVRSNFWEGDWWYRVGNSPLTGILGRDVKEGKLVQLPKVWRDFPELFIPRLDEVWEERTNFLIPCYAYAAADIVAANEPVFDV